MHARSAVMRALQSAASLPGPQRLGEKRRSVSSFAAGGFSLRRGRNRTHTEAAPAMEGSRPKELIGRSRRTEPPGHSCFVLPDLPFCGLTQKSPIDTDFPLRRRGRVAEGGGLLNRYTLIRRIEGSNPSVSAKPSFPALPKPHQSACLITGY